MGFFGIGVILMLLTIVLATVGSDLIYEFLNGWKRTVMTGIVALLIAIFALMQSAAFIAHGEREAAKECLNGDCPYEREIRYKDTDTGKTAVDTVYHLK